MSRRFWLLLVLIGQFGITACQKKADVGNQVPPSVSSFTRGIVSKASPIEVVFADEHIEGDEIGNEVEGVFSFRPRLSGTAQWSTRRTLTFFPEEKMKPDESYQVTVALDKLNIEGKRLSFSYQVRKPTFQIVSQDLVPSSAKEYDLVLKIATGDDEDAAAVEKMITTSHAGSAISYEWRDHQAREHTVAVQGILRQKDDTVLKLTLNGRPIGAIRQEVLETPIPGLDNFTVTQVRAVQTQQSYIEVMLSDPVSADQRLKGLISVKGKQNIRFTKENNVVKLYSNTSWRRSETVVVDKGLKSAAGYNLKEGGKYSVSFVALRPSVRFLGSGTVVPKSDSVLLPIKTARLRGVMVEAVAVPKENLTQFLQVNEYQGNSELNRVGRIVWRDEVSFGPQAGASNVWEKRGLDLKPLIENAPAGLYQLRLSFLPSQSTFECNGQERAYLQCVSDIMAEDSGNWDEVAESSYWDMAEGWGVRAEACVPADQQGNDFYSWGHQYYERKNPCSPAYYREFYDHDIKVTRNVVVSDLGIVSKYDGGKDMVIAVSSIASATPIAGAEVRVLDFQQQELLAGTTDANGFLRGSISASRPNFVVVTTGDDFSVLRMNTDSSLSVAHFDTSGSAVEPGGVKGQIYGERGVWKPGDTMHLSFSLFDPAETIPDGHPVSMTVTNSRGSSIFEETRQGMFHRFASFEVPLENDSPTGNYTAKVQLGAKTFSETFPVEVVKPNRLKIEMDVPEDEAMPLGKLELPLFSQWLHGASGAGLRATVQLDLARTKTTFAKYDDYSFDDPTRMRYDPRPTQVWEGTLDDAGQANVTAEVDDVGSPPGRVRANLITSVFEPSGDFSTDRAAVELDPYEQYVGVRTPPGDKGRGMLLTDEVHTAQIAALGPSGKAVSTEVEVSLYKVRWRWWWEKGEDDLSNFASARGHNLIKKEKVKVVNGKGEFKFEVKYPSWGRYLLLAEDQKGGHRAGKILYMDWPGWAGRARKDQPGGATVLSVVTDKRKYDVGETAMLTFPGAEGARGLLSIESGGRIVDAKWIDVAAGENQVRIPLTAATAPSVYANLTLVQPHQARGNDRPVRMYGVTPIEVVDPSTKLQPVVETGDEYEPNSVVDVQVRESEGRPMTYTLAVVDEGLLGLTRYRTPDLWGAFYRREALGVRTWDSYGDVVGAFAGKLEQILAIGGGEESAEKADAKKQAERFDPMVRFAGPFFLEPGQKRSHKVEIPHYIGAVRVMVVAGDGTAFGSDDKSVFVRKPLMLYASAPEVVAPGEIMSLPVSVFALEEGINSVKLSVKTEGGVTLEGAAGTLEFDRPGDKIAGLGLRFADTPGKGSVEIIAKGGRHKAKFRASFEIRNPGVREYNVLTSVLEPGNSFEPTVAMLGVEGSNQIGLEVSTIPPLNLNDSLDRLLRYPHGCAEQTTSAAFPQLYVSQLVELDEASKTRIGDNIKAAIERLSGFQQSQGAFALWPGVGQPNDWVSSYVGHFLLEAKTQGYVVPPAVLTSWTEYQQRSARAYGSTNASSWQADTQAYRLYTLALNGTPNLAAMNRLKESKSLVGPGRWRLAAAYKLAGRDGPAKKLVAGLASSVGAASQGANFNTYGSQLRDQGLILASMVDLGMEAKGLSLARDISTALENSRVHSTQSLAYALMGLARLGLSTSDSVTMAFTYGWGGKETKINQTLPVFEKDLELDSSAEKALRAGGKGPRVKNTSSKPIFVSIIASGVPPLGKETAKGEGVSITDVRYESLGGDPVDPLRMRQGEDFVAVVTVSNPNSRPLKDLAYTFALPSGWQVRNNRLDGQTVSESSFSYRDYRGTATMTYFSLKRNEKKTFKLRVNASYEGRFYQPPLVVDAMYQPRIHAKEVGRWVEVLKPGEAG